jgi:hypothetical protein
MGSRALKRRLWSATLLTVTSINYAQSWQQPQWTALSSLDKSLVFRRTKHGLFLSQTPLPSTNENENKDFALTMLHSNIETVTELERLRKENEQLQTTVQRLVDEMFRIAQQQTNKPSRIVLETFEGEGRIRSIEDKLFLDKNVPGEDISVYNDPSMWCNADELANGACPLEPDVSFGEALRDRSLWLVGLLVLQSLSGFILARNEGLLETHPVIIYFLTMLVGAGKYRRCIVVKVLVPDSFHSTCRLDIKAAMLETKLLSE